MSDPKVFFAAVAAAALSIHEKTGGKMFPETLMVQFADETGWHQEGVWEGKPGWKGKNNLAGISPGGQIADYSTTEEFVNAYVETISQDAYGFPLVLAATNPELQMVRLGRSQWAGTHYDANKTGKPGVDLINTYRANKAVIESSIRQNEPQPQAQEPQSAPPAQPEPVTPAPTPVPSNDLTVKTVTYNGTHYPAFIIPTPQQDGQAATEIVSEQFGIRTLKALGYSDADIEKYLVNWYGYAPEIATKEAQSGYPVMNQTPGLYKKIGSVMVTTKDGTTQTLSNVLSLMATFLDGTQETLA